MYRILLVDDDYFVLEFLNRMIPWGDLGFEVVGLCEDGQRALNMIKDVSPDVIITDIGMPKMDGISLIKQVKMENERIHSIFLTCYDEFNYAQQAIKLNSFDYILKENMDSKNIIKIVKSLKVEMDKEVKSEKDFSNMRFLIKENLTVIRSSLLERLLNGNPEKVSDWLKIHEKELELDLSFDKCIPILAFIDDYEGQVEKKYSENSLKFIIENVVIETLGQFGKGFCLFHKEDTFFIFFSSNRSVSGESIQQVLRKININLVRYMNTSITVMLGESCEFPNGLKEELNELLDHSEQRFYMESGTDTKLKKSNYSTENLFHYYIDSIQEVKKLIIEENYSGLEKWVANWKFFISEKNFHPKAVKKWILGLVLDVEKMIQSMQNFESEHEDSFVNKSIVEAKTAEQLAKWLLVGLKKCIKRMEEINDNPKKEEIIKAKKYVLLNLDKKITLKGVAKHLHLNPSYFSRLFKQHTQINFIDYVNQTKIEKAKELIDNSNESIENIADMLGFESKNYFLKVFKKYFGSSPSQYKLGDRKE